MARILSISSQVISGHVGNSAITFALQRCGHDVLSVPTILLSNHPGHQTFAGSPIDLELLNNIFEALNENGEFEKLDAIITGYLPTLKHAELTHKFINEIRRTSSKTKLLIDPVLGDHPKGLYIKTEVADFIKNNLVPEADIITPNFFELQWLTDNHDDIVKAANSLKLETVIVTSAPGLDETTISNILVSTTEAWSCTIPKRPKAPNGTGDFFAALYLGNLLNGQNEKNALSNATGSLKVVLEKSWDKPELQLIPTQQHWVTPNQVIAQKL